MLRHQRIKRCNFRQNRLTLGLQRDINTDRVSTADNERFPIRRTGSADNIKADFSVKPVTAGGGFAANTHQIVLYTDLTSVFAVIGCGKCNRTGAVCGQPHRNHLCRIRRKDRAGIADAAAGIRHISNTVDQIQRTAIIGDLSVCLHGKTQITGRFIGFDAEEVRIEQLLCQRIRIFALTQTRTDLRQLFSKALRVQL